MRSTFADRADLQPTRRPRLPPVGSANSRPCAPNSVAIPRTELLRLAINYDRRGDHLDRRT